MLLCVACPASSSPSQLLPVAAVALMCGDKMGRVGVGACTDDRGWGVVIAGDITGTTTTASMAIIASSLEMTRPWVRSAGRTDLSAVGPSRDRC